MFDIAYDNILTLLWVTPLFFGVLSLICKKLAVSKIISFTGSVLTFFISVFIWVYFDSSSYDLQFAQLIYWFPSLGINYFVGIDGISLLLIVLTSFLISVIILNDWYLKDKQKTFYFLILMMESTILGSLISLDFVLFYIFWESMLIPMFFLIGYWGGKNKIYANIKFLLYTVFGSLFMLFGFVVLYVLHYQQFGFFSSNILDLYKINISFDLGIWIFLSILIAFAVKIPIWPLHSWLPDAHTEAPTSGSVILAGVLLKLGIYGILRFLIPIFPNEFIFSHKYILSLGSIAVIYGSLIAWVQSDIKKMIAYSSIAHLGFIVIGIFSINSNLHISQQSLTGSVYQMIVHGINTSLLFLLIGIIYRKRSTRNINDFGGLARNMPIFATIFMICVFSSIGVPGTAGFIGEFLILIGSFKINYIFASIAVIGVLLGAIYMLYLYKKIFFGPLIKKENRALSDINYLELSYLIPLTVLIFVMGLYPNLFLYKIEKSLNYISNNFSNYSIYVK